MATVSSAVVVGLAPGDAFDLWTDLARWPSFVDGFARVDRVEGDWPAPGAEVAWRSVPAGRGEVSERVRESERGSRFVTEVREERMKGTQTVSFAEGEEGTQVELVLDYEADVGGPLRKVVDVLFIRRVQRDALGRTLARFATEAAAL